MPVRYTHPGRRNYIAVPTRYTNGALSETIQVPGISARTYNTFLKVRAILRFLIRHRKRKGEADLWTWKRANISQVQKEKWWQISAHN